jgi:hypothetical protein
VSSLKQESDISRIGAGATKKKLPTRNMYMEGMSVKETAKMP